MNKRTLAKILKPFKGIFMSHMRSAQGNIIANQFIIYAPNGSIFQSYNTIIAIKSFGEKTILDRDSWDYSVTTGKYRNQFLNEGIAETRKKIESGEYILADLN